MVIATDTAPNMKILLRKVTAWGDQNNMEISTTKSKMMQLRKSEEVWDIVSNLFIYSEPLEVVEKFKYLGAIVQLTPRQFYKAGFFLAQF